MKTTYTLSKYFKNLEKKINKILKKPFDKYDEEDYHKLRVEIKKLNALLDLVKGCSKNFKRKKYFKPVKKIFKQSGKARELQLEESTLKKYEQYSLEHYLSEVKDRIKKEQNNFHSLLNKKLKKKIKNSFKQIGPFIKVIRRKEVAIYIVKERKKISDLVQQKPLKPIQVHELRKSLKVDFYNRKSLNLMEKNNLEEEDNFQELLGKWHDGRTMNDHLERSIIKEEIDPTELKQLLDTHEEISLNTRDLLKEINTWVVEKNLFV